RVAGQPGAFRGARSTAPSALRRAPAAGDGWARRVSRLTHPRVASLDHHRENWLRSQYDRRAVEIGELRGPHGNGRARHRELGTDAARAVVERSAAGGVQGDARQVPRALDREL